MISTNGHAHRPSHRKISRTQPSAIADEWRQREAGTSSKHQYYPDAARVFVVGSGCSTPLAARVSKSAARHLAPLECRRAALLDTSRRSSVEERCSTPRVSKSAARHLVDSRLVALPISVDYDCSARPQELARALYAVAGLDPVRDGCDRLRPAQQIFSRMMNVHLHARVTSSSYLASATV